MKLPISWRSRALLLSLISAPCLAYPLHAARVVVQSSDRQCRACKAELDSEYQSLPKVLPAPGANTGLLLVDVFFGPPFSGHQILGSAVVATDSTGVTTRARYLSRHKPLSPGRPDVVLFHDLAPGAYRLRFIVAEQWRVETIALELPDQILCRPDCAGLCPVCGKDLNVEPHEHIERDPDPRWAPLEALKDELDVR